MHHRVFIEYTSLYQLILAYFWTFMSLIVVCNISNGYSALEVVSCLKTWIKIKYYDLNRPLESHFISF